MSSLRPATLWLAAGGLLLVALPVAADSLQDQINSLQAQNTQNQQQVQGLQVQASDYQSAINNLQSQIAVVQGAISQNQAKQADLQQKIADYQNQINHERTVLGEDVKTMYVSSQMSTIEMLATSKNLSDFVDKQEYRQVVQQQLQDTMTKIAQLQSQLEAQKQQVDQLVTLEKSQQAQLANDEAQQNQLLSLNQTQQANFNSQIQANNAQIAKLQAEQVAQNRAMFGSGNIHYGGTGSYPYAGATCMNASGNCGPYSENPYNWGVNGQPYDPAGWQYRNCTSFAFWRLAQAKGITLTAGSFPTVYANGGKIGYSIPDFRSLGYTVDHNPSGATLAVEGAGPYGPGTYGHIMYVNWATGNIEQYNVLGDGLYSTAPISSLPSSTWFIHM